MGVCISAEPAETRSKKNSSMPKQEIEKGGAGYAQLIRKKSGSITEQYELGKELLGIGSYGSVVKGKCRATSVFRAIKEISKKQMKKVKIFGQEVAIMKMMDHPNIIKLFETFEDQRNIYLVMELCSGGELFDRIVELGHFTERQAANLMQQIFRAIYYMHENHVCHRDLKPQNFLFKTGDCIENNILKIIDFGLSCKCESGQVFTTKAGSPHYVAPEVLAGKSDQMSDLWSCGVLMYVMLCGYPPFFGDTDAAVLSRVKLGNFSFNKADWKVVSEDAKQLIHWLMKVNPRERFTAEQALNHEWIKSKAPKAENFSLQSNFVEDLRSFRSQNKLQKAALHIIAGQLNERQIKALRETFMALDENGDGRLSVIEIKAGIQKAGLKEIPPDFQQIMEDIDADGSGAIDYTEFLAATLDRRLYLQEDVCWMAFRVFDGNSDGKISQAELKDVLAGDTANELIGEKAIADILQKVDTDGSGDIDFGEFMNMMKCCGTMKVPSLVAGPPIGIESAVHSNTAHSQLYMQTPSTVGSGRPGAVALKLAAKKLAAKKLAAKNQSVCMTCVQSIAQWWGLSCLAVEEK